MRWGYPARMAKTRPDENGFDRLDRKIGMAYSRVGAWIFMGIAFLVAWNTFGAPDFSVVTHWPALAFMAVLLWLARVCYRSREGMLSLLSDVGVSKDKK